MFKLVFLFAFAATAVNGQVVNGGWCPGISAKSNFDWRGYAGKWYTNSKVPNSFDINGKCIVNYYNDVTTPNANLVHIQYNMTGSGITTSIGKITIPDMSKGEYIVSFPDAPFGQSLRVKIIDTDYGTWSVAYGCYDQLFQHMEFLWVKTRPRFVIQGLGAADAAITASGINRTYILPVDLFSCPLFL